MTIPPLACLANRPGRNRPERRRSIVPGERAAAALAADPTQSTRAVAGQIGVSQRTVARAREAIEPSGSTASVVGLGGRSYPARRDPAPSQRIGDTP
jgi:hypothetical protein